MINIILIENYYIYLIVEAFFKIFDDLFQNITFGKLINILF